MDFTPKQEKVHGWDFIARQILQPLAPKLQKALGKLKVIKKQNILQKSKLPPAAYLRRKNNATFMSPAQRGGLGRRAPMQLSNSPADKFSAGKAGRGGDFDNFRSSLPGNPSESIHQFQKQQEIGIGRRSGTILLQPLSQQFIQSIQPKNIMGAKFVALQEEFQELEEQHEEAMVNFRAIRDEAIRLLKKKDRPNKKLVSERSTSPGNIRKVPEKQIAPKQLGGVMQNRSNINQSGRLSNIGPAQSNKISRNYRNMNKNESFKSIKNQKKFDDTSKILSSAIQGSASSLSFRQERFKKALLNDNNPKMKRQTENNNIIGSTRKAQSQMTSVYHSMKPSDAGTLKKLKYQAISRQNNNTQNDQKHHRKQQRSLDQGRFNNPNENNNKSLKSNNRSNPHMPVYFDLQKKLPMIYAQKQLLKSPNKKNNASPDRKLGKMNKNLNQSGRQNSKSFSRVNRHQFGDQKGKNKGKSTAKNSIEEEKDNQKKKDGDDDESKILTQYGRNSAKQISSTEALLKVSRKGIINKGNRETITLTPPAANIRQKKLIFLKSKKARFINETEKHVNFWLTRREVGNNERSKDGDDDELHLSQLNYRHQQQQQQQYQQYKKINIIGSRTARTSISQQRSHNKSSHRNINIVEQIRSTTAAAVGQRRGKITDILLSNNSHSLIPFIERQ